MLLIIRCHCYDRAVWLRAKDTQRINDALGLCEEITSGAYPPSDVKIVLNTIFDFLMMGGLEKNTTEREKVLFLSTVYTYEQIRKMERFFSTKAIYYKVCAEIYLKQRGASLISPEYKRIQAKIAQLPV